MKNKSNLMDKAQASIELIVIITTLLFLFAFVEFTVVNKHVEMKGINSYLREQKVCQELSSILITVHTAGEGASFKTEIEIKGKAHLYASSGIIVVESNIDNSTFYCTFPAGLIAQNFNLSDGSYVFNTTKEGVIIHEV